MNRLFLIVALLWAAGAQSQIISQPGGLAPLVSPVFTGTPSVNGATIKANTPWQNFGSTVQSLFLGVGAGSAYPIGTENTGYTGLGIGAGAMQSVTSTNSETTALGTWACQFATGPINSTCLGMHAIGADLAPSSVTAVGNDAMRDAATSGGIQNSTAIGAGAMAHGSPGNGNTAVGLAAMRGNSSALVIGGSKTTGDVLNVTISGSGGGVTGLPVTATYTVQSGDTMATIASGFSTAISTAISGVTGPSYDLRVVVHGAAAPSGTYVITFEYPGSGTTGWALTFTPSVTGAATETISVVAGSTPSNNTAIGYFALFGAAMGNLSNVTAVGYNAGMNITIGNWQTLIGANAGANLSAGNSNTIVGYNAGDLITIGSRNTIVGQTVASITLATGSNNILIGTTNAVDTPAASTSNWVNIGNTIIANAVAPTISSGFGTTPTIAAGTSSAAFQVNVGTGGIASSGVVAFTTAALHGWACSAVDGTNAATSNTVATPTSTTTITLTNYGRTTGIATAWAASDVITVTCNGY